MEKIKIAVGYDQEMSARVQKVLFRMGYFWNYDKPRKVRSYNAYGFYGEENGEILYSQDGGFFNQCKQYKLFVLEDTLVPFVEKPTIEVKGKTYLLEDIENLLHSINPIS